MSLYTYIDLYENGERCKNIGFVKSEEREERWRLKVSIQNLPVTDTLMCEMKSLNQEAYIDRFQITGGKGCFSKEYSEKELQERNINCKELRGLLFQLSSHRYGRCIWGDKEKVPSELTVKIQESDKTQEREVQNDEEETIELPEYQINNIENNKWRQLGRMYTTIHPFHEEEKGEYISIKPKDFVILQEQYQVLVSNSFLLHGYFNYRHIILGKVLEEHQTKYYLGVPGTFHQREKTVAVMFGFERFLGVDSEETGAFGYYMREVKI